MNNEQKEFNNSDEYQSLLRDIVKYSKRQMTWFKRNKGINWVADTKTRPNDRSVGRAAEVLARRFLLKS